STRAGAQSLLTSRNIGVAGNGDGGNTLLQYILGLAPSESYHGLTAQQTGRRPQITWFGQPKQTAEGFSSSTRGVYAQICTGYTSGLINPIENRVGAIRRSGNSIIAYPKIGNEVDYTQGVSLDKLVISSGFENIPDSELLGDLAKDRVLIY